MRIADVMVRDVTVLSPDATVAEAARVMAELDCGAVTVGSDRSQIAGIITGRDILLRVVAHGLPVDTPVGAVMSADVTTCRPEDQVDEVARAMAARQVRRMPVLDADGGLVGLVTLADIERGERP